jgi:3-oxoacyl-[acyl-carrier protein] reductase
MDLGLEGKVALVTASSKGLGKATAQALSQEGAKVVICARNQQALDEAAASMPGETLAVRADVADPAIPQRLVDVTVDRFGALHILVANAGGPPPARALEVTDDQLLAALQTNLLASIRLVQAALPSMRSAGWGRICLVTSKAVKQPIPTLALSNTARTGLWAWAKTAAADLFAENITCNLACPGTHDTDRARQAGMIGEGPVGDPADFGKVVCFLCSEPARFISGTALQVDGATTTGLL